MHPSEKEHYCEFIPSIFLKNKRIHQILGPSRIRMLLFLAQKISGPIFWIKSSKEKIFLHPDGISPWLNPDRLVFVYAKNQIDKLWAIEKIIESRSSRLIVANLNKNPNFNSIRRLNLAIKSDTPSTNHPICIFFTDCKIDIKGVESRWFIKSVPSWTALGENDFKSIKEKWVFKRVYCRTNTIAKWVVILEKKLLEHSIEEITVQSFGLS